MSKVTHLAAVAAEPPPERPAIVASKSGGPPGVALKLIAACDGFPPGAVTIHFTAAARLVMGEVADADRSTFIEQTARSISEILAAHWNSVVTK